MTEGEIQESIKGHNVRNAELLKIIEERNIALDEVRSIEHHFWAPSQMTAALLAKELYKKGYLVLVICRVEDEDGSSCWNVEAALTETAKDAASDKRVSVLVRLAADFEAIYDGWGTSI